MVLFKQFNIYYIYKTKKNKPQHLTVLRSWSEFHRVCIPDQCRYGFGYNTK